MSARQMCTHYTDTHTHTRICARAQREHRGGTQRLSERQCGRVRRTCGVMECAALSCCSEATSCVAVGGSRESRSPNTLCQSPSPSRNSSRSECVLKGTHDADDCAVMSADDASETDAPEMHLQLEARPFRPFKSSEEYLYAMKEDLAEWFNMLYSTSMTAESFSDSLETGVLLCQHANNVRRYVRRFLSSAAAGLSAACAPDSVVSLCSYLAYNRSAAAGSFFARDNVHNFIGWCRRLGVLDCLLFETEDLVSRKNERHVILCLLEVARRGARFGMAVPVLVQFEQQIDRELADDDGDHGDEPQSMSTGQDSDAAVRDAQQEDAESRSVSSPPLLVYEAGPQVVTNDLKSLHEMVRDLVERCTCPSQFPMIRVSEGKYRIGDTKSLIFVRVLRNHVMVRVGGGWDTLQHFLDKHDPCRCKSGHRSTVSSKLTIKSPVGASPEERKLSAVTYERKARTPDSGDVARPRTANKQRQRSAPATPHQTVTACNTGRHTSPHVPAPASCDQSTPLTRNSHSRRKSGRAVQQQENFPPSMPKSTTRGRHRSDGCTSPADWRALSSGSVRLNRAAATRMMAAGGGGGTAAGTWTCGARHRTPLSAEMFTVPSRSASNCVSSQDDQRHVYERESRSLRRRMSKLLQQQCHQGEPPSPRRDQRWPGTRTKIPEPTFLQGARAGGHDRHL